MDKSGRANPTQEMRQHLQEQKQVSTIANAQQQEVEKISSVYDFS